MSYDDWLEEPYQRRAARDEAIERVEEDLWNGGGPLVTDELAAAVALVADHLPNRQLFAELVVEIAETIIEESS